MASFGTGKASHKALMQLDFWIGGEFILLLLYSMAMVTIGNL